MANKAIYENALQKFKNEYNLPNYDLESEITTDLARNFLNGNGGSTSAQQFERLAANAATMYFESLTNLQTDGAKKLTGFNVSKFITDFEELAKARYESKLEGEDQGNRAPFAGSNKANVKKAIEASATAFNKPLPTLWKDQLKSGYLKIEDARLTTNDLFEKLTTKDAKKGELDAELKSIVAAREAMRQLRESRKGIRGFFWKIFNREQNRQEIDLHNTLEARVEELEEAYQYDVSGALREATLETPWEENTFERTYAQDLSIDKRPEEKLPINENEEDVIENKEQEKEQLTTFNQEPTVVNNNIVNEEIVQQENLAISNDMNNDLVNDNVPNLSEEENKKQIEDKNDNQIEDEETSVVEEEIEEEKTQTFADKFSSILNQPDFADTFAQALAEKLPSGRTLKHEDRRVETYIGYILEVKGIDKLGKKIDGLNKKFDEGMAAGRDEDELMQEYMKGIIPEAYEIAGTFRYEVPYVNNLVITQLALDYMIQNYSPATQFESLQRYKQGILFEDKNLRHVASTRFTDERTEMAKLGYDKVKDVGVVKDEKESVINDMRVPLDNDQLKADVEGTSIETKSEKVEAKEDPTLKNVKE